MKAIFQHVLEECVKAGVKEFCLCPGSRNSPLVNALMHAPELIKHFWYEERSAAFFALGRARLTHAPVAVLTTSGTAAGELLPATMEAYYTGTPLLLITADRPRRFRGTGAPQTAEQEGLFGIYTRFAQDLEGEEICRIQYWDVSGPAHLNVCIEEPKSYLPTRENLSTYIPEKIRLPSLQAPSREPLDRFFEQSKKPLIIVSALPEADQAAVKDFLLRINAPVYCEGGSGLREDPALKHLQLRVEAAIWQLSERNGYAIDGVLRLGGIPVTRLWRDLEERPDKLAECSLSGAPFSGLSWGHHMHCCLKSFLPTYHLKADWRGIDFTAWLKEDQKRLARLQQHFDELPTAEPSLYHALSKVIPEGAMVYVGNSLPVREWDLAATFAPRGIHIEASRGLNGIDGQIATFLGLCKEGRDNWAILGDLTTLYDFAALWILQAMPHLSIKIVVMNNGGGKLFARIYKDPIFQHLHDFDFEHFAKCWRMPYHLFHGSIPSQPLPHQAFIEICPEPAATESFWQRYDAL